MRLVVIERNGEEELVYFQLACDLLLALWICEGGEMLWEATRERAEVRPGMRWEQQETSLAGGISMS
jgi:hypothetical protein